MSLSGFNTLQPVTFLYEHDSDLLINQATFTTQQGLNLNLVNALSACNDTAVLNYSNIFLTNGIKANDFAHLTPLQSLNLSIPTYLALSSFPTSVADTWYVTLSSSTTPSVSAPITLSRSLSDAAHSYFVLNNIDGIRCFISILDNGTAKNLTVDTVGLSCYFANFTPSISSTGANLFEYSIDRNGWLKLFFRQPNNFYVLRKVGSSLSAVNMSTTTSSACDIIGTTYKGIIDPNFANNFIYYNQFDSSSFQVNEQSNISDLAQNHVLHYNYESKINFTSAANAYVDFFKAKNFLTDDYTINDRVPFADPVTQRRYTTITSKQNSETYNGDLQLSYNYYTKNYNFLPDLTTQFTLPETLYPYKVLNVDDSSLTNNGAYGGKSPVFSDKIAKNLNGNLNVVNYNEQNGTYLYTWLYTDTSQLTSYWVDRYYYPKYTSINVAYSGTSNQVYNYTPAFSAYLNKAYPNNDFNYYDVRSSLTFEPSASYFYSRIGNNYINKVLNTLPVHTKTFTKYEYNSFNTNNVNSIAFNKNYGSFVLQPLNNDNSFTLSFDLTTDNLSSMNCNVIVGNNFDEGITIYKGGLNNIYTPGFIINDLTTISLHDKQLNKTLTLDLSSAIGNPYRIIDVINYGFDHLIKVFYFNLINGNPGIAEFSITGKVHSKVEFPYSSLIGKFYTGSISKTYIGNNQIVYTFYALSPSATIRAITIDYINNVLLSTVDTYVGPGGTKSWGSSIYYNNNVVNLSGYRGVRVGNYGVSKNYDQIYYKDLTTNLEYISLSAKRDYFFDLLSYNDQLYVQTLNQISVYDQFKRSLGTFSVNTSAVSGFKLDIINDNYVPKLLSLFKNENGNISIAKYDLNTRQLESSSATSVSAYDYYYQDLLYPYYPLTYYNSLYITPTNFNQINNLHNYGKYDVVVRADLFSGNDTLNKSVAIFGTNLLQNVNQNLTLTFDSAGGNIILYNNGVITNNVSLSAVLLNGFLTSHYLNNNFGVGIPFIDNTASSNILPYDYASNFNLSNFIVYTKNLNEDEVKFNFLSGGKIDTLTFDVPQGARNNTDTITSFVRYSIPGRKNNNAKIYIKNLDLTSDQQQLLTDKISSKLQSIVPVTTNNIEIIYLNNE